jgi:superfamily II DNA or RNA helicase
LLADAVGLGKTYVALAIASKYRKTVVVAPPSLLSQWRQVSGQLGITVAVFSDQSLSRARIPPVSELLIVDEAHRFRNPDTRRYDVLARRSVESHLLLLTATPVVNRGSDLVALLSLFLADNGLAVLGVPSIRAQILTRQPGVLARAAGSVIVARSPEILGNVGMPIVRDAALASPPPIPADQLRELLGMLRRLSFPTFADRTAAALLAMHLAYRLASSAAALAETVDRHISYLHHAIAAAESGEKLSRQDARALFEPEDDAQLGLDLRFGPPQPAIAVENLLGERERLREIREWLRLHREPNPKANHLAAILEMRGGRKTLVFASAVATARDLARRLGWRRVAVATGSGAWIASGGIPVETALRLFAPIARAASVPESATTVQTLIATDLVSEGLNLQDADAVVHYDLPWTPLRLQQRLGRIARLGSAHHAVDVSWFAPPPELDAGLSLVERIERKAASQLRLAVPVSSRVGKATILAKAIESRELLAQQTGAPRARPPVYSTVKGPDAAVFVLRWCSAQVEIPEVVVLRAGQPVEDLEEYMALLRELIESPQSPGASAHPPSARDLRFLHRLARDRLVAASRGPLEAQLVLLGRRVARRAASAARKRDESALAILDQLLGRIDRGIPEGERRRWEQALEERERLLHIPLLLRAVRPRPECAFSVRLEAALFGNGR